MITLGALPDAPLGVAVSGGGDSVALLLLLHQSGRELFAATVNHQLRPEAAAEAAGVAKLCAELRVPHVVLAWESAGVKGNLQKAAREARRDLLGAWAQENGLKDIALGHTLDDQAETVLMRLARGSGVDGLAGMAAKRCENGLCWHRPLLGARRADLRNFLRENNIGWVDDPSNDDLRFDRVKARQALETLAPLGLDARRLSETASHMQRARKALEATTLQLAQSCTRVSLAGEVSISRRQFADAPREIQLRLLSAGLVWVANAAYRPRFAALEGLLEAILSGEKAGKTLHGCTVHYRKADILINRELSATPAPAPVESRWDRRWRIHLENAENLQIRALGQNGLSLCLNWRDSGYSRAALLASPSFWKGAHLMHAPFAGIGNIGSALLVNGQKGFYEALITH